MKANKVTRKVKAVAAKKLLDAANGYEIKQRAFLKGVHYTPTSAHWCGYRWQNNHKQLAYN